MTAKIFDINREKLKRIQRKRGIEPLTGKALSTRLREFTEAFRQYNERLKEDIRKREAERNIPKT